MNEQRERKAAGCGKLGTVAISWMRDGLSLPFLAYCPGRTCSAVAFQGKPFSSQGDPNQKCTSTEQRVFLHRGRRQGGRCSAPAVGVSAPLQAPERPAELGRLPDPACHAWLSFCEWAAGARCVHNHKQTQSLASGGGAMDPALTLQMQEASITSSRHLAISSRHHLYHFYLLSHHHILPGAGQMWAQQLALFRTDLSNYLQVTAVPPPPLRRFVPPLPPVVAPCPCLRLFCFLPVPSPVVACDLSSLAPVLFFLSLSSTTYHFLLFYHRRIFLFFSHTH